MGNRHPNMLSLIRPFDAQDKAFILACGNDTQFKALCSAIGLPDLKYLNYVRNQDRVKHREALVALLAKHFSTQPARC